MTTPSLTIEQIEISYLKGQLTKAEQALKVAKAENEVLAETADEVLLVTTQRNAAQGACILLLFIIAGLVVVIATKAWPSC